jgi:hypothetical protein
MVLRTHFSKPRSRRMERGREKRTSSEILTSQLGDPHAVCLSMKLPTKFRKENKIDILHFFEP